MCPLVRYSTFYIQNGTTSFQPSTTFRCTPQPGAPPDHIPHVDVNGDQILQTFGLDVDAYWKDVGMLCVLAAVFLTATFVLLRHTGR